MGICSIKVIQIDFLSNRTQNEFNKLIFPFILFQLKEKKKKMKVEMIGLQDENLKLQLEIQKLNSKLQKQLKLSKHDHMNPCSSIAPNPMDEVLETLKKRTTTQLVEDGVSSVRFFFTMNFNIRTLFSLILLISSLNYFIQTESK